jgi:hypothetical protein
LGNFTENSISAANSAVKALQKNTRLGCPIWERKAKMAPNIETAEIKANV